MYKRRNAEVCKGNVVLRGYVVSIKIERARK